MWVAAFMFIFLDCTWKSINFCKVPSCIAVSPEGLVRYWPSIAHEGTSVEETADLQGQECDSLININPQGNFNLKDSYYCYSFIDISSIWY